MFILLIVDILTLIVIAPMISVSIRLVIDVNMSSIRDSSRFKHRESQIIPASPEVRSKQLPRCSDAVRVCRLGFS